MVPMKKFAAFIFCLLGCCVVFSQKLYPLHSTVDSLSFQLEARNRQLNFRWQEQPGFFGVKRGDFPVITAIELRESDLVLRYQPGNTKSSQTFEFKLWLRSPGGESSRFEPYELLETAPPAGGKESRELVWQDFTETLPEFDAVYQLYVERSLMGAVNCAGERPAFTLKKQLPHYAAGTAALVLIGLGQVYNQQKKDAYRQYQMSWAAGNPREDAENPFFQTASDKRNAARICTYTGWTLLGADALWYAIRQLKFRRRQKTYDKFCAPPALSMLRLHPALLPQSPYPGLGLSFTFSNSRP